MRFCSTPESAVEGEITGLAIVETVVAVALSVLLVKLLGSGAHIVVGALVAPFLLLGTESSMAKAFSMFDACCAKVTPMVLFGERLYDRLPAGLRSFTFLFVVVPVFAIVLAVIRIIATAQAAISSPREVVLAIPRNWLRIALAKDYKHPPELLAGVETAAETPASVQQLRYAEVRRRITSGKGSPLFQKVSLLALYGPTVVYRMFLKSTSIIYFPLIWLTQLPLTVKAVLSLPLERVRRWYACAVLIVMVSPFLGSFRAQETLATAQDRAIFTYVLPVHKTDLWHISRVVAVAVTIALYFYARNLDQTIDEDSFQQTDAARRIIRGANGVRAVCAVFTMACFLLIILTL